jgi:hypothetical protein
MVDSISAPLDDRCAIESCRRPKHEHRQYGHAFVAASQLVEARPRPRDPFLNIRKMNDEERRSAGLPVAEGEQPMVMKDEAREETIVTPPCVFNECGRQKTSHRGRIGHRYLAPDATPLEPETVAVESNDVNDNVTSAPKSLKQMTLGILASIIDDAIRSMNTPSIPMIDDIHIAPEFNIDRSVIIAAKVKVTFSVAGDIEG